jgi:hypothetical protein
MGDDTVNGTDERSRFHRNQYFIAFVTQVIYTAHSVPRDRRCHVHTIAALMDRCVRRVVFSEGGQVLRLSAIQG